MTLDSDTVRMGYRLILDRTPGDAEIKAGQEGFGSLQAMRQAFFKSREFKRKYARICEAMDENRAPTLVQLEIPGTGAGALRDQLLAQNALQPSMPVSDDISDTLRQLPHAEQRGLRFIYGDLVYGAGDALENPHHYITLIADPGVRLHSLWHPYRTDGSFGSFLEAGLEDTALRLEIDNGQIRRLAGNLAAEGIGQEKGLLQSALHRALGPDMFVGFADAPQSLLDVLGDNGLFDGAAPPHVAPVLALSQYDSDLGTLTPPQQQLFESYTAWDTYLFTVCRQFFLPNAQ
ncbi:hypothetical protein [Sulfitobacter sp. S190]|uniref:hypothetical protein n=1 Tax=Sulfitobacter sp. S190 TaxID=2867022 RepID=UPI0021A34F33|nr:hypothetical protein [Sulfitobacter sp. S190]UWR24420.1 hypothetical protein K3756_18335 [Sulfitobacter sp. S190]